MCSLKPPKVFEPGENPAEAWARWEQRFLLFYEASELERKTVSQQRATLLHIIGDTALEVYNTFSFNEQADALTVEVILNKYRNYYKPFKNTTYQRYIFATAVQTAGQSIDEFVTSLRTKSKDCEFGDLTDSLICDRLVSGIKDRSLAERLLREHALTLAVAVDLCRAAEASKKQSQTMALGEEARISVISKHRDCLPLKPKKQFPVNMYKGGAHNKNKKDSEDRMEKRDPCSRCCRIHAFKNCPAYGKTCHVCKRKNHFAKACRLKTVSTLENDEGETTFKNLQSDISTLFIGLVEVQKGNDQTSQESTEWYEPVVVNGKILNIKIDTGSQANIIPAHLLQSSFPNVSLLGTDIRLKTYTGEIVPVLGKCMLNCEIQNHRFDVEFLVVKTKAVPILGLQASRSLGLLRNQLINNLQYTTKSEQILEEYSDLFEGLGKLPGCHRIRISESAVPIVEAPRKLPQALYEPVKAELERMEQMGIICKVNEPTEWASPIVVVPKENGKVRICMDPRNLNQAIMREHHQIPVIETILAKIKDAKLFTVLDASSAFWQVQLDDYSSKLCTIVTPFGRYRFLRLPYGMKSAPEVYQKLMDTYYGDKPGVLGYFDDILVWGSEDEDHDKNLREVLETARDINMRFKKEKLQLAQTQVSYVGHTLSPQGISLSQSKTEAIQKVKSPGTRKELQRILGMINYLGKFLPDLSQRTAYLRQLMSAKTEWTWDSNAERELAELKELVIKAPIRAYFSPNKEITLSVDSSQFGLGAVLLQEGRPVAYASAALTETQQRYAQIEKELLAIVFACERFHYFIYGYEVNVQTNHLPLVSIVKKPFESISPRLQRMVLKLQRYNLHLKYVPGKEMFVADALSREPDFDQTFPLPDLDEQTPFKVVHLLVSATDEKLKELQEESSVDAEIQLVGSYVQTGWPDYKASCKTAAKPYWEARSELYYENGLLCKGQQIVIPENCRKAMLKLLHIPHQGVVATKRKAKEAIYWPQMMVEIEETVLSCEVCREFNKANCHEPLLPHEVPQYPWQKVGVDFFYLEGQNYLILVDYFSKYIELQLLKTCEAPVVITALKSMFARFGVPEELCSDNGPPYNSLLFKQFCKQWKIRHTTSSPLYPRSNGMVERQVQTLKTSLKKGMKMGIDPYELLLANRTTPLPNLPSPSEILMGRRLRSFLPMKSISFVTETSGEVRRQLQESQEKQKLYADRHTKPLKPMKEGQHVYMQTPEGWVKAKVTRVGPEPRSYVVQTEQGRNYRRNRIHLREGLVEQFDQVVRNEYDDLMPSARANCVEQQPAVHQDGRPPPNTNSCEPVRTRCGRTVNLPLRYRN